MDKPSPLSRAREYERAHTADDPSERPLFHLTPPVGWMNDPNGFCRYQGEYHLFYQYHPYSAQWGPMHWGHAVSGDLLRWRYLPCALAPDTAADAGGCFSGSALPLADGRLMLAYTGVAGEPPRQAQCLAFGDGVDFEKYPGNPVLPPEQLPPDCRSADFRDPKLWQGTDGTLFMAVGDRHRADSGTVLLLSSRDGLQWDFRGALDSGRARLGQMWECPDFFALDGRQVLLVSPQEMQGGGDFHPGHHALALLGRYDEAACRFTREAALPLDWGLDFYAPQTVLAPDGRRILIAWMENWGYCQQTPRRHSWYGQMTLPRELRLADGRLLQQPVAELARYWQGTVRREADLTPAPLRLPGISGRTLDLTLLLTPGEGRPRFTLRLAADEAHETLVLYDFARQELVFDRSACGSRQDLAHIRRVPAAPRAGSLRLRLILDRESAELFIGEGETVLSCRIDTPQRAGDITFAADGPLHIAAQAHPLGI